MHTGGYRMRVASGYRIRFNREGSTIKILSLRYRGDKQVYAKR